MSGAGNQQIRWYVTKAARAQAAEVREIRGDLDYFVDVRNLREFLGGYFDSSSGCTLKLGRSISPLGAVGTGKILKVRWIYPGAGKERGPAPVFRGVLRGTQSRPVPCGVRRDVDGNELMAAAADAGAYVNDDDNDYGDPSG